MAPLTKDDRKQRIDDLKYLSDQDFAEKYGITVESAKKYRQKHGVRSFKQFISPQQFDEIVRLYKKGYKLKTIQDLTGSNAYRVQRTLYEAGLGPRPIRKNERPITLNNVEPLDYTNRPDTFDLEPEDRARFEELKARKQRLYNDELQKGIENDFRNYRQYS